MEELMPLFSPGSYINGQVLLISPAEFNKLEGKTIHNSRVFLLVCEGCLDMIVNGISSKMKEHTFFECIDTAVLQIENISEKLCAWCLIVDFSFISESLKNLRPGPISYLLTTFEVPIRFFSEQECNTLEVRLQLLADVLNTSRHYYKQELAYLYFKGFNLELGNILFNYVENRKDDYPYICKRDFIALNFTTLVEKHFAKEHGVEFYSNALCISTKHLTRIIKELTGKTPHTIICDTIVHHAMTLLEDERLLVSQIAEELNFFDQASFCRFFKRQVTVSPMEYRRKIVNKK